jgi:hypothetical protein
MCVKTRGCAETTVNKLEMIVIEVDLRLRLWPDDDDGGFLSIE